MPALRTIIGPGRAVLLLVAADSEAKAVAKALGAAAEQPVRIGEPLRIQRLGEQVDLVQTGVGKANAAAAVARLADSARHGAVLNLGICGALPTIGPRELPIGSVVLASRSVYADEGIVTSSGFSDCGRMGFPLIDTPGGVGVDGHPRLIEVLKGEADAVGPMATVSTCSGTDQAAMDVARRTGAIAEAMEGAAAAAVLWKLFRDRLPFAEIRVVSNTTGNRDSQKWDLPRALDRLDALTRTLLAG